MHKQYNWILCCLCLISIALLNGCSSMKSRADGPPSFYVDETRVPNATPKPEKLAKYGNMQSYRVFGKKYYVMKSAKNFQETGMASWYGMKWHKQRTSSGERYDILGMTAAHRTLPLPTYVQVTNLKNDRTIIVKVNDRGPFASNRIIDLSYVAAKKLGMVGHGTTQVAIKAIDPQNISNLPNTTRTVTVKDEVIILSSNKQDEVLHAAVHTPANRYASSGEAGHYLQVGAFRNRVNAERLKQKLVAMVHSPVEITRPALASNSLYRVKIGPIKDFGAADDITRKLRAIGLSPERIKT